MITLHPKDGQSPLLISKGKAGLRALPHRQLNERVANNANQSCEEARRRGGREGRRQGTQVTLERGFSRRGLMGSRSVGPGERERQARNQAEAGRGGQRVPVTGVLFHSDDTYWMPIIRWALCQAVGPGMNQIPAPLREGVGETDRQVSKKCLLVLGEKGGTKDISTGPGGWSPGYLDSKVRKETAALPVRFGLLGLHQNFCFRDHRVF